MSHRKSSPTPAYVKDAALAPKGTEIALLLNEVFVLQQSDPLMSSFVSAQERKDWETVNRLLPVMRQTHGVKKVKRWFRYLKWSTGS